MFAPLVEFDGKCTVMHTTDWQRYQAHLLEVVYFHDLEQGLSSSHSEHGLKPAEMALRLAMRAPTSVPLLPMQACSHAMLAWVVPRCVCRLRGSALIQQRDNLAGEAGKVYEDALLVLQALEVFLANFQRVKEEEIVVARDVYPQYLKETCVKGRPVPELAVNVVENSPAGCDCVAHGLSGFGT